MKKIILILSLTFMSSQFFGQTAPAEYYDLVNKADSLFLINDYVNSALTYSKAFKSFGWKGFLYDRYNASCSWALAVVPDSAFFCLERIVNKGLYTDYDYMINDTTLNSLHSDKRWQPLIDNVKQLQEKREAKLNKPLISQLDSIYNEDQMYRLQIDSIDKKYGNDSKELKDLWKIINKVDSINLIKVTTILDKYGWLGPDVIEGQGMTLFLVIQHSDLKTQEKYKPMMEEAVKSGYLDASLYAMLVDRIEVGNNRPQIYGTQVKGDNTNGFEVCPIIDEVNVNNRRAEVGLGLIEDYLKFWNIEYKLPKK